MGIVAEFSIPPEAVPGGETLNEMPEVSIHLERIVPTEQRALPFFWVVNADTEMFLDRLESEPEVEEVTVLTELDTRALFKAEWAPTAEVIEGIKTLQATILEAKGTSDEWEFQVRAEDRQRLAAFQHIFTDQGIPVEVRRVYNFAELADSDRPLTIEQRETLITAYELGYFDHPRTVTQGALGDHFGITGRAVSDRLRRGTKNLIASTLLEPEYRDMK